MFEITEHYCDKMILRLLLFKLDLRLSAGFVPATTGSRPGRDRQSDDDDQLEEEMLSCYIIWLIAYNCPPHDLGRVILGSVQCAVCSVQWTVCYYNQP